MSANMKDNPQHAAGKSRRRKIIDEFEINLGRCILCGICVDVCNFDAIEMSHEHELSKYERNGNRVDLPLLLDMGKAYQAKTQWQPKQPQKNSGVPLPPKPKRAPTANADAKPNAAASNPTTAAASNPTAAAANPNTAAPSE